MVRKKAKAARHRAGSKHGGCAGPAPLCRSLLSALLALFCGGFSAQFGSDGAAAGCCRHSIFCAVVCSGVQCMFALVFSTVLSEGNVVFCDVFLCVETDTFPAPANPRYTGAFN